MLDNMISLNERMVMLYSVTGEEPRRGQLRHIYPRGAYECSDGHLAINVPDNLIWKRLCETIGRADLIGDPRCVDGADRASNARFVDGVIESWLADKTRTAAEAILNERGVPVGPVYTAADVFSDPHVEVRKVLVAIEDPDVGTYQFARTPVVLSGSPEIETNPAPRLGQHTEALISDLLGYEKADLERLKQAEVI
jgi:crotonobetainyl-CoA:carnitine CoA-transferase CaiB-like acyl-CoA transferase